MIGPVVKSYRESRGISQKELAEATGLTQSYVSQIESSKRTNVSMETLQRLAKALGITVDELIRAADLPAQPSTEGLPTEWLRELQKLEKYLTLRDRRMVLKIVRAMVGSSSPPESEHSENENSGQD